MGYFSLSILVTELNFALKICKFWFFWNSCEIPEFIVEFENIELEVPRVSFDIQCSKCTYIRSISRDLGSRLGCGAHLSKLIRTGQEKFMLSHASSLDDINLNKLISLEDAFEDLGFVQLKIFMKTPI